MNDDPLVVHQIVITSGLRQGDGARLVSVDLPDDAGLTEILGLLDFARFRAWQERQEE